MWSIPHYVDLQIENIRRFAFHVFLLPFVAESMDVVADEEVRAAFFVPLRQPAPERFSGNKATTSYIMQTASVQRSAHKRTLSSSIAAMTAWLNAKSISYTAFCGFSITRREVLHVNAAFIALTVGAMAAATSLLITFVCILAAALSVRQLNRENTQPEEAEKGGQR